MDTEQLIKERNEAFASMDETKIKNYCKKYKIEIPEDDNIFWAGVHKVVCELYLSTENIIDESQYDTSFAWLCKHGYTPSIL